MACRGRVFFKQQPKHNQQINKMLALILFVLALSLHSNVSCSDNTNEQALSSWTSNEDSWNYWWSYSGVSGPSNWGLLNLDWFMCDKGRRQSPINIETRALVFDPNLTPLSVDNNLISGVLYNDGHAIVFNATPPQSVEMRQKNLDPNLKFQSGSSQVSVVSTISSNNNDTSINSGSSMSKRDNINYEDNRENIFDLVSSDKLDSTSSLLSDFSNSITNNNVKAKLDDSFDIRSADSSANYNLVLDDRNTIDNEQKQPAQFETELLISGAGLMYSYRFEALYLRFSNAEANSISGGGGGGGGGSEHRIDSHSYAAEIQIMSYNSILYKSYAEASSKPHGLLGIAIMVDLIKDEDDDEKDFTNNGRGIGESNKRRNLNEPLEVLLSKLDNIKHRGHLVEVGNFNLSALISDTNNFVIYEGSLTIPSCDESVNWLVLNKPLYISQSKLNSLRSISAEELSTTPTGTLIAGNIRPIQPVNNRPIRTNIKPPSKNQNPMTCPRLWTRYEYKH